MEAQAVESRGHKVKEGTRAQAAATAPAARLLIDASMMPFTKVET